MAWSSIGNIKGPTGTQGPQGPTGPASTVPGPQGPAGATGPPGPTQVSGDAANTAMLGSDNLLYVPTLPLATTTKIGALQKLSGNTTDILNGTNTFGPVPLATVSNQGGIIALTNKATDVLNGVNAFGPVPLATSATQGGIAALSNKATDFLDGTNHFQTLWKGFIGKTAAYTLTAADSGTYVVCSGGSWTLTLPAPALGLMYQVRNDMGISGTTGTITLQPNGGTIDGLASRALLPQQECTLITDGANWRTFGLKREVVLGTLDISVSTASASILLPAGFRYFDLLWTGVEPATNRDTLVFQLSFNGGSTWLTTGYYGSLIYNNSATTAIGALDTNVGQGRITSVLNTSNPLGQGLLTLWPGTATMPATYIANGQGNDSTFGDSTYRSGGRQTTAGIANALKYFCASGNMLNAFLTVKGVV